MSTSPTIPPTPPAGSARGGPAGASRRLRWRFGLSATILVVAATVSAILLGVLGSRTAQRFDLTATRQHQLSPSSQAVLKNLDRDVELVLAADFASVDRSIRQRTLDVLEKFNAAGPRFKATLIDTSSKEGLSQYDELLQRLARESQGAVDRQRAVVTGIIDAASAASGEMAGVGESLQVIRDQLAKASASSGALDTLRRFFDGEAAKCRSFSEDLKNTASRARTDLTKPPEGLPVPPLDGIARSLRAPLAELAAGLPALNTALDRFSRTEGVPGEASARADIAARSVAALRDGLARRVAEIDALTPLPIVTIARTIQRTRAALLIAQPSAKPEPGERNIAAIDTDVLLPRQIPGMEEGQPSLDTRFRTEELIAAGLATFTRNVRPVAVFVHAAEKRLMPTFAPVWGNVAARLTIRGIDCNEWPVLLDDQPPVINAPSAGQQPPPVVYVLVGLDVRRAEDAQRMSKLASAAATLIKDGKNVLVSVSPSTLPASGNNDPMTEFLGEVGLKVESGLSLMEESRVVTASGSQRFVTPEHTFFSPGAAHAISGPLTGSLVYFPWAVPMHPSAKAPPGVTVEPLLTKPAGPQVWAESEWLAFWQTPRDQRGRLPQPSADSPRDLAAPTTGEPPAWWLAAAIERRSEAFKATQRVVVVGCPTWFFDTVADAQGNVDGRAGYLAPGNLELLHASIAWLAGREDLIARSAESMAMPTIPALTGSQLGALRLALIAGLPVCVLVLGAIWRLWRG